MRTVHSVYTRDRTVAVPAPARDSVEYLTQMVHGACLRWTVPP